MVRPRRRDGVPAPEAVGDADGGCIDGRGSVGAALYYDASTMAPLNPASRAAVERLRAYQPPPFPLWDALPIRNRAAILLLLYPDRRGDLRVVITMRAAGLSSFSGHAALPGGKADSLQETPYQIARREAFEEIGLPMDDLQLPPTLGIEPLCLLPPALARTLVVVRPCVALLSPVHPPRPGSKMDPAEALLEPRLDPSEVAAVFSAPVVNFLKSADLPPDLGQVLPSGRWYDGWWTCWQDVSWRVHNFYVPVNNQIVSRPEHPRGPAEEQSGGLGDEPCHQGRFKVWGMTGRVLVDAARIAYAEEPEMEYNTSYGDYDIIMRVDRDGGFNNLVT